MMKAGTLSAAYGVAYLLGSEIHMIKSMFSEPNTSSTQSIRWATQDTSWCSHTSSEREGHVDSPEGQVGGLPGDAWLLTRLELQILTRSHTIFSSRDFLILRDNHSPTLTLMYQKSTERYGLN